MQWLLTIPFLILAASTALAADHRWELISNESSSDATIENSNKVSFGISCSLPTRDVWGAPTQWGTTMRLEYGTSTPNVGTNGDPVQFIVDGKSYPFRWDRHYFFVSPTDGERGNHEFVTALASSDQKTFVVRFPKFKHSERFSLLDARKALGSGKDFILYRCENPPQQ
jgi:hypothetical protein